MKRITLKIGTLVLALMFVCPAFSQITLKYNLKKGEIYKQNTVTSTEIAQKISEQQEIKVNFAINMKTTYEVKDVKDENYTLEMKYKEVKLNIAIPGKGYSLSFDSNTPEDIATLQDMGPILKATIDKPVEIIITKTGTVESVKGVDKILEAMSGSIDKSIPDVEKKGILSQFSSQFSDEHFKTFFAQNSSYFPNKPVDKGDTWDVKLSTTISNFTLETNVKTTLKSIDENVVTIDTEGTVSTPEGYEWEMNGVKAKTALKGMQKGPIKIDKNTGWIIFSDIDQSFSGEIEVMGMKMPMSVTGKTTITSE
jgi:hypothetical protein